MVIGEVLPRQKRAGDAPAGAAARRGVGVRAANSSKLSDLKKNHFFE